MKKTLIVNLFVLCILSLPLGCGREEASRPPFLHPNAVFVAEAGNEGGRSPVAGNYSHAPDGSPLTYAGGWGFQNGTVEIKYQFVGAAFCPVVPGNGKEWEDADVYVVHVLAAGQSAESIPVIYRGGEQVVLDRPELRLTIDEGRSEPSAADDADKPRA